MIGLGLKHVAGWLILSRCSSLGFGSLPTLRGYLEQPSSTPLSKSLSFPREADLRDSSDKGCDKGCEEGLKGPECVRLIQLQVSQHLRRRAVELCEGHISDVLDVFHPFGSCVE